MSNSYYENERFLIIAPTRSGGTFLSHALDSHHEIFCERGEVLHRQNPIWKATGTPYNALNLALSLRGYKANGAKLTYAQFGRIGVESLKVLKVSKVIHLYRESALRRIISERVRLMDKANDMRTHTYEDRPMMRVFLPVDDLISTIETYEESVQVMAHRLEKYVGSDNYFDLTYETMTDNKNVREFHPTTSFIMCHFLGVTPQRFYATITKRNPFTLKAMVENYEAVKDAMLSHNPNWEFMFVESLY